MDPGQIVYLVVIVFTIVVMVAIRRADADTKRRKEAYIERRVAEGVDRLDAASEANRKPWLWNNDQPSD